ncbi:MAG: hypothetical protein HYS33_01805 [Acidobacteria bacterium]|nr:hypothetical protein [Acidobacteriota bacterium]
MVLVSLLTPAVVQAAGAIVTGRVLLTNSRRSPDSSRVVVWLNRLSAAAGQDDPTQPQVATAKFRLIQKRKRFEPHVLVVPVGAVVEFPNLDPLFHNVFSLFEGKRFDLGLYEAGTTRNVRFDRRGVCYIFCNIHPEMGAVVIVSDTPYYGISDAAGEIRIPDVPPGRYRMQVWYERSSPETLQSLSREITVSEGPAHFGTLRLSDSNSILIGHKNKYGREYDAPYPSSPLYTQP